MSKHDYMHEHVNVPFTFVGRESGLTVVVGVKVVRLKVRDGGISKKEMYTEVYVIIIPRSHRTRSTVNTIYQFRHLKVLKTKCW